MKLNCDLGEGYGIWRLADEAEVMPYIDMANIACGYHAGDPLSLQGSIRLAKANGVQIGAHPGYPDLAGFGRRSMACQPEEITAMVIYQLGALQGLCRAEGTLVQYVKPHGALYWDTLRDQAVMRALLEAVAQFDSALPLMILASPQIDRYRQLAAEYGVELLLEAFADRRYGPDGSLLSRTQAGAVLETTAEIIHQAQELARGGVTASDGSRLQVAADTLCVHGDNPQAVAVIREIREALSRR
ncbi:5-oxoprolinase subunit PxpA [Microbulbifer sp. TYP-18]|uniref:5-oxoprolinase subunit PxpA n=1 Tax=Microbulbifer sp. TYP-18 TaxID=3230024 RepID=UPI0034C5B68B